MGTLEAYQQLMDALNTLRQQWRTRKVIEGVLLATAAIFGLLVVTVLLDNVFRVSGVGRALLAMTFWGGTLAVIGRFVVTRMLEDRRDDFFAAIVEEKFPDLRNRLINALQLGRGDQRGHSPELIGAIISDAANATADMDMNHSIDAKPFKRASMFLVGAILVTIIYAMLFSARFNNGVSRVLMPWSDIPAYTATRIVESSVKPGDRRVPEGDSFLVEATVEGVIPSNATLHRKANDAVWQAIPMQPDGENPAIFRVPLSSVIESFDYYIAAGDGRSRTFHLDVVPRPRIDAVTITYDTPAYTGQGTKKIEQADGDIAGVVGTTVMLEIQTNKPIKSAEFLTRDGQILKMESAGDSKHQRVQFVLWASEGKNPAEYVHTLLNVQNMYQVRLIDADGIANFSEAASTVKIDPLWRPMHRTRDAAPLTIITVPNAEGRAKANTDRRMLTTEKIDLTVEARDDFGVAMCEVWMQINDSEPKKLIDFAHTDKVNPDPKAMPFTIDLPALKVKGGDRVLYWSTVIDHNNVTGPGRGESRKYALSVFSPEQIANIKNGIGNYIVILEELIRLQTEARTQSGLAKPHDDLADAKPEKLFAPLVAKEQRIRAMTNELARTMEKDPLRIATMISQLDALHSGKMANVVKLFEQSKDSAATASLTFRDQSLPVQDAIIEELKAMLARLQRNEQAKKELTRLSKTDQAAHQKLTNALAEMLKKIDQHLQDSTELMGKFEALPKRPVDELKEEKMNAIRELDEFTKRTLKWTKDSVNEMTKMGAGFVDDFSLRKDANRIYEEVEAKAKQKSANLDVALEDMGVGLATRMKEDLELWLADMADNVRWRQEEMTQQKPLKIPEMALPKSLEDLVGDLLQKADEFDEEADDATSAWADNLDQAGWGVSDGPISSFSAKGKTGNDQPNNQEVTGRSGDGRRGKSSGQMVGDTSRALPGRKTPARVGNERYEPGQLKQEGQSDPNGATGGGKKAGGGRQGLQGGTPPDEVKDIGRLNAKQAGLRERMEQVAKKLDDSGVSSSRLREAIDLMKGIDTDLRDLRYQDAARKRVDMMNKLRSAFGDADATKEQISRAKDLPANLRNEMLQSSDEGVPQGYEKLMKNYFKALSGAEK